MVVANLDQASQYYSLGPAIEKALRWLRDTNLTALGQGKHPIEDDDIYAIVDFYTTRPESKALLEAHRKHIDVQYILDGVEKIGYAPAMNQTAAGEYHPVQDVEFFHGEATFVTMHASMFAIFYPEDLHMPGIMAEQAHAVKKVVVKIRISEE